jgi:hypothetical protein
MPPIIPERREGGPVEHLRLSDTESSNLDLWPAPWRMEFEEMAAFYEFDCNLHPIIAERWAYNKLRDRFDPVPLRYMGFYPGWPGPEPRRLTVKNLTQPRFTYNGLLLVAGIWRMLTLAQFCFGLPGHDRL